MDSVNSSHGGWVLFGNYGTRNIGDEVMLLGLVSELRHRQPRVPITVLMKSDAIYGQLRALDINVVEISTFSMVKTIFQNKGVILGGGTHFHDDYQASRFIRHLIYMLWILVILFTSRLLGKKVYLLGMGFGPIRLKITSWIARLAAITAHHVVVRDDYSLQMVLRWVPPGKISLGFDPAALLWNHNTKNNPIVRTNSRSGIVMGVSVISIENIPHFGEQFELTFEQALSDALRSALEVNKNLEVRLFVFRDVWQRDCDVAISQRLWKSLLEFAPSRVSLIRYENLNESLKKIAECDVFLATRYHSAVLSFLSQLPSVIITYHLKCLELAKRVGYPDQSWIGINEVIRGELTDRISQLVRQPASFQARMPVDEAITSACRNIDALPDIEE